MNLNASLLAFDYCHMLRGDLVDTQAYGTQLCHQYALSHFSLDPSHYLHRAKLHRCSDVSLVWSDVRVHLIRSYDITWSYANVGD